MRHAALLCLFLPLAAAAQPGRGASLLSLHPSGDRLLAANADNGTVSVVDLAAWRVTREIAVGARPESVAWIGESDLAVTADYDDDTLTVIDTAGGEALHTLAVADEPYGVVVDRAGQRAYVSHTYPGTVSVVDLSPLPGGPPRVTATFDSGQWSRGICLLPDESALLVTDWYSGTVTKLDAADGKTLDRWPGRSAENLSRHVSAHPTLAVAYAPLQASITTVHAANGSVFPYLAIVGLSQAADEDRRWAIPMDTFFGTRVTSGPWETAFSPDGSRCYSVFAGTDDLFAAEVVDGDYRHVRPLVAANTGRNPRAVVVGQSGAKVYVYDTLDYALAEHDAGRLRAEPRTLALCEPPYSEHLLRGKRLFNTSRFPMSGQMWVSCASCHPDGDHDGRTWLNPSGLRRTTHFFGMSRTYPLHWSADRDEMQDFEHTIRGPLMAGGGLVSGRLDILDAAGQAPLTGLSPDLDALADWCNSLEPTRSPHAVSDGVITAAAYRGRALFRSQQVGCAGCHSGPDFTDNLSHDVGTAGSDPAEKLGPAYDTPSLLRCYRETAYLHHGGAASLREVFTLHNPDDRHGRTSHLTDAQIGDLVQYLKSLPVGGQ